MLAFSLVWVVLAVAVVLMATARKFAAPQEDDYLQVRDSERRIANQKFEVAQRLDTTGHWGKAFTAVAVVYGLALLTGFLYVGWQNSQILK